MPVVLLWKAIGSRLPQKTKHELSYVCQLESHRFVGPDPCESSAQFARIVSLPFPPLSTPLTNTDSSSIPQHGAQGRLDLLWANWAIDLGGAPGWSSLLRLH